MHPTNSAFLLGHGVIDLNYVLPTQNALKFLFAENTGEKPPVICEWFWFNEKGILEGSLFEMHVLGCWLTGAGLQRQGETSLRLS